VVIRGLHLPHLRALSLVEAFNLQPPSEAKLLGLDSGDGELDSGDGELDSGDGGLDSGDGELDSGDGEEMKPITKPTSKKGKKPRKAMGKKSKGTKAVGGRKSSTTTTATTTWRWIWTRPRMSGDGELDSGDGELDLEMDLDEAEDEDDEESLSGRARQRKPPPRGPPPLYRVLYANMIIFLYTLPINAFSILLLYAVTTTTPSVWGVMTSAGLCWPLLASDGLSRKEHCEHTARADGVDQWAISGSSVGHQRTIRGPSASTHPEEEDVKMVLSSGGSVDSDTDCRAAAHSCIVPHDQRRLLIVRHPCQSAAIRANQRPSVPISGHPCQSAAISSHQRHSHALTCSRSSSNHAIIRNQWPSAAISGHQRHSQTLTDTHRHSPART
jgi:hypothetical protein